MTDNASPMHQEAAGAPQAAEVSHCRACLSPFTARKSWQHFCGPRCRNAWHCWTRPEAIREARELLRLVLAGDGGSDGWRERARKLLGVK